jgi:phosphoserine aminotransferase
VACSSKDENFNHIPRKYDIPEGTKYLHITSNNTVYGSQFHWWPDVKCPVVADMSSDIFSRQIDFNKFGIIYAGAQKNMGAAGVTMVAVSKELLGKANRKIPAMLDYRVHIAKESMHNTPPVFAVYLSFLTLQWIKKQGLKAIEERNNRKAKKLYDVIDASSLFEGTIAKDDRSLMNVCFRFSGEAKKELTEEKFVAFAAERNIVGIKGYKTVGGFRASIYNAMSESGVDTLIEVMREFEKQA